MSRRLPGNAIDTPAGGDPVDGVPGLAAGIGVFGSILVDSFGQRVGMALEVRARRLLCQLHRHHPESCAHSLRVAGLTMDMWRMAPEFLGDVETALLGSLLHDVGKLAVPQAILSSSGLLTVQEREVVSTHSDRGAEMLRATGFPDSIVAIAQGHHERWAGGGYPSARPADGLPPIVLAVAVADAFDAMTDASRGYRAPLGRDAALAEVAACAGTHFGPVVAALLARSLTDQTEEWAWHIPAPATPSGLAAAC